MSTEVLCPTPQRSYKRALADIYPNVLPGKPPPLPTPSTYDQYFESIEKRRRLQPNNDQHLQIVRSDSAPPWPTCTPGSKHCRPQIPLDSPIDAWILSTFCSDLDPISLPSNRPSSCPSTLNLDKSKYSPPSFALIKSMFQQPFQPGQNPGTGLCAPQGSKVGTSHWLYREVLYGNYVTMDVTGRQMPEELRTFVNTQILKQRESSLEDEAISKVLDTAEEIANSTEYTTSELFKTAMFPFEHPGIVKGGGSQWNTIALPNDPECALNLSAPKPDIHFGYRASLRGWSRAQFNVFTHPAARPYSQPVRGATFPFLMVEAKSEATGGTIHVAENQAAGSGSHSVNSMLWLLGEAGTHAGSLLIDTIAFTIAMSSREAIIHLHWYSETDRRHYMSLLNSFSCVAPKDIQACHDTIKNIIDFGLGRRKAAVCTALGALVPIPQHWNEAITISTVPVTTAT
ncbi:MAG: hypothetical protein Q9190_002261 [Brigantiaea leucoxantha]